MVINYVMRVARPECREKVNLKKFKKSIDRTLDYFFGDDLRFADTYSNRVELGVKNGITQEEASELNWRLALFIPQSWKLAVSYDQDGEQVISKKIFRIKRL